MLLSRFKSTLLLIFGGVLCALSFTPFDFIIGAMIGVVPLLWVEESISQQGESKNLRVFFSAYLFFASFNFFSIWWVAYASPIGVIASVIVNSLFFALITVLYSGVKNRLNPKLGYLSFIVFWVGWEYVELMDWDLSWPWLNLGHSLANWPKFIQWFSITGVLGGTLWLLVINLSFFFALKMRKEGREPFLVFRRLLSTSYIIFLPIVISLVQFYTYEEEGKEIDVVVLQPNMDPYYNNFITADGEVLPSVHSLVHVDKMLKQASEKLDDQVDFLLMHETALPRTENSDNIQHSPELKHIKRWREEFYPNLNVYTGIAYKEYKKELKPGQEVPATYKRERGSNRYYEYFNSSLLINGSDSMAQYHKSRLVIGVERIPSYFVFLQRFMEGFDDNPDAVIFNPNNGIQAEREVFKSHVDSAVVAPIICYEAAFGEYVTEYVEKGANFLGVITNDAWWEDTPGHKQQWSLSKLRAIETRRSVARSANTGWSGFINQRGEELQRSEYMKPTVMRQKIKLNNELTFYVKYGDVLGRWALVISVLFVLNLFVKKIKGKSII